MNEELKRVLILTVLTATFGLSASGCTVRCEDTDNPVEEVADEIEDAVD